MLKHMLGITKKELSDYFSSLAAYLFLSVFLAITYIIFFWVEAFFARNLADMRPFFDWLPVLMIFLVSVLTMGSWSEERRRGTIELQVTSPVPIEIYIAAKFFAAMSIIVIALLLTLPLAITVDILGELDWGPVLGGYIAAVCLASAYTAIGLWASSQSDNQIVGLILSVTICALLYIIGSNTFTQLFSYQTAEWLRMFASGARFESITRGVLDMRDIVYYLSLVILFLLLNRYKILSLQTIGNVNNQPVKKYIRSSILIFMLLTFINITLTTLNQVRLDLTQGKIYTLSAATRNYLDELNEPLLIRGYFSSNTHPLLSPLVPRVRDLLNEYSIQSNSEIKIEFIDPLMQPKFEQEAGVEYGIRPVSFETESKYQSSIINTYFNILISYGDQYEVLNYKDLVELKASAGKHEIDLENPEYQITRAIMSVVGKANRPVHSLKKTHMPLVLTGYVSAKEELPVEKKNLLTEIEKSSRLFKQQSNDNFDLLLINPDDDQLTRQYLQNELGVRNRTSEEGEYQSYWFHFTLTNGQDTVPVNFTGALDNAAEKSILAAYKRMLPDTVNTVALMKPLPAPGPAGVSESPGMPKNYSILRDILRKSVSVIDIDMKSGMVPEGVNFLMVLAPRYLTPEQINAIEKYLAEGGNVLLASSPIDVNVGYFTEVYSVKSGLEKWLDELGVNIENTLVLDDRHGQYILPTSRAASGIRVRETSLVNYPYIIDVRDSGLNSENPVTAKLGQVYVPWASPITIDTGKNKNRNIITLLQSSPDSWKSSSHNILPDYEKYPDLGFFEGDQKDRQSLAVILEGLFPAKQKILEHQPGSLAIVSSSAFLTDNYLDKMSRVLRTEYRRPVQLVQNLVDWSLTDKSLLNVLRKHSQFTRTLKTQTSETKKKWEYLNYIIGFAGLAIIVLIRLLVRKMSILHNQNLIMKIEK